MGSFEAMMSAKKEDKMQKMKKAQKMAEKHMAHFCVGELVT